MKPLALLIGIAGAAGTEHLVAGELLPYHRRATVRCGVPGAYNYVRNDPANPVTQETFQGELIVVANPPVAVMGASNATLAVAPVFWQLRDSELRHEHCHISNVTLWIDDATGDWRLSLTAAQNPFVGPERQATPAVRFLRNKFYIKIRAVGGQPVASNPDTSPLSGPEMLCIEVPGFWVEREQMRYLSFHGQLDRSTAARVKYVNRLMIDLQIE